jgi:predicted DNA-binding protein
MLKWLLRWCKSDATTDGGSQLTGLYDGDRGIADLHDNDAELRLWLPEPLRMALDQTAKELITSESQYLRELLTIYLYGVHEILRMRANKTGLYFVPPPPPDNGIRFSKAAMSDVIPGLGKNIIACKLRLPSKMKTDLQFLAERRGIPLGRFVREILVQHFLGHTVWPDRFQEYPEQQIADNWVDGRIEAISKFSDQVDSDMEMPVQDIW